MLKQPILVAGLDEVGTTAIAGPIVACVAVFDHNTPVPEDLIQRVTDVPVFHDSKSLKRKGPGEVEKWFNILTELAYEWRVASIPAHKIDKTNCKKAANAAMRKAVEFLSCTPEYIAIDGPGKRDLSLSIRQYPESKADKFVWQVAAASIIAKHMRDTLMEDIHNCVPSVQPYGFNTNMGEGRCEIHQKALKEHGVSDWHRRRCHEVQDAEAHKLFHPRIKKG